MECPKVRYIFLFRLENGVCPALLAQTAKAPKDRGATKKNPKQLSA